VPKSFIRLSPALIYWRKSCWLNVDEMEPSLQISTRIIANRLVSRHNTQFFGRITFSKQKRMGQYGRSIWRSIYIIVNKIWIKFDRQREKRSKILESTGNVIRFNVKNILLLSWHEMANIKVDIFNVKY